MSGTACIIQGDCRDVLPTMDADSIDAIVTDPPYGIGFMGREWDTFSPTSVAAATARRQRKGTLDTSERWPGKRGKHQGGGPSVSYDESPAGNRRFQAWCEAWATEALRVAKPGAHLVAFGGTRTFHRLVCGIEDAGWEIRDCLMWLFGSGYPKSKNMKLHVTSGMLPDEWFGWGTALKPAWEPIVLARKPLSERTVAANVLRWGTGALNIDGCRIPLNGETPPSGSGDRRNGHIYAQDEWTRTQMANGGNTTPAAGRWPANVVIDECAAVMLDAQTGELEPGNHPANRAGLGSDRTLPSTSNGTHGEQIKLNAGGASRFYYVAKASRAERDMGLAELPVKSLLWSSGKQNPGSFQSPNTNGAARNHHPTVKPVELMQWLVRLVTPPDGRVLDPFTGSGSTLIATLREGFEGIGIEREPEYVDIACRRIVGDAPLFNSVEVVSS